MLAWLDDDGSGRCFIGHSAPTPVLTKEYTENERNAWGSLSESRNVKDGVLKSEDSAKTGAHLRHDFHLHPSESFGMGENPLGHSMPLIAAEVVVQ